MTIQFNGKQLSTKRLGSVKINKIMLGMTEVYPRLVPPIIISVPGGVPHMTQYVTIEPFTVQATGGIAPYVFTVVAGAFPTGITMSTGGLVSGAPQDYGLYNVIVRATDAQGHTGEVDYTGNVEQAGAAWDPSAMYGSDEPGFWYDFDDDMDVKIAFRRNQLLWSEDFSNAYWYKSGVTVTTNVVVAPDGATTADKVIPNNGVNGYFGSIATWYAGTTTFYVKEAGHQFVCVVTPDYGSAPAVIDLLTGVVVYSSTHPVFGAVETTVTLDANGFYKVVVKWPLTGRIYISSGDTWAPSGYGVTIGSGNGTDGIYLWGMQYEYSQTPTAYQKVTDWNTEFLAQFPNHALFQDQSGAVAVTYIEQPIGLILDKSKKLVKGTPVSVVDTSTTDGWNGDALRSLSVDGNFVGTSNPTWGIYYPIAPMATVIGQSYEISFTVVASTSLGGVRLGTYASGQDLGGTNVLKLGVNTLRFTAKTTTSYFWMQNGSAANGYTEIKDITFNTLAGNHYSQATATKRSVWSARKNRIYYSEQFDTTGWNKLNATVVANVTTAPDGTLTADALVDDSTLGEHTLTSASNTVSLTSPRRHSIYAKQDTGRYLIMNGFNVVSSNWSCVFDLQTGTVTQDDGNIYFGQATIEDVGDGWWRCSASTDSSSADLGYFTFGISNGPLRTDANYAGTGQRIYVWGAQSEQVPSINSPAGVYQRIALTTDYNPIGFPKYTETDGVDDAGIINNGAVFDLSMTDKLSIFGGITQMKTSGATGMIFENNSTGTVSGSVNNSVGGDFSITGWHSNSTGSAPIGGTTRAYSTDYKINLPIVMTAKHNIEASLSTIAINRVPGVDGTASKGTGNFGSYPAFMFARNQAGVYAQVKLSQYVFLGRLATAEEVTETENYIATKSGVTLP